MQTLANTYQTLVGPAPGSVVSHGYKTQKGPDGKPLKCKAVAWMGTHDVRLLDVDLPDITEDGDIILKVTATSVCGSDLHLWHGEMAAMKSGK